MKMEENNEGCYCCCFESSSGILCSALKSCFFGIFGKKFKQNPSQHEEEIIFNKNNNNYHQDNNNAACAIANGNHGAMFCQSLRRNSGKRRLTKDDIKHFIDQQIIPSERTDSSQTSSSSVTRLDSLTSRTSAGSGTDSNLCRERYDSDRSQESASSLASYPNVSSVFERIRTYSFTSGTSGLSKKQPIVDIRPIEFWTSSKEQIQPRMARLKLLSESGISLEDLRHDLYIPNDIGGHSSFTVQQSKPQPPTKQGSIEEEQTDPPKLGVTSIGNMEEDDKLEKFKLGQLHVGIHYETEEDILIVKIIEARNLPLPILQDQSDLSHSNPYVKLSFASDDDDAKTGWENTQLHQQSQQTSVRRKTQNPVWDEKFHFQFSLKDAMRMSLLLTVRDFDKYSRHCCLGQVTVQLGQVNLLKGGHFWRSLTPTEMTSIDLGNLLVSLNFLPAAGRLNIDVIKAHQITQTDLNNGTDSYVKVTQFLDNKQVRSRKTSSIRGTIDPEFDESLSFDLRSDNLNICSLVFSVWSRQGCYPKTGSRRPSKTLVGRFSMGKYSTGKMEQAHWNCLIKFNRSPAARWHALLSQEDCESKCAISAYMSQ